MPFAGEIAVDGVQAVINTDSTPRAIRTSSASAISIVDTSLPFVAFDANPPDLLV